MPPKKKNVRHHQPQPPSPEMAPRFDEGPSPLDPMYQYNQDQQREYTVLLAVYGDDFKLVEGKKSAWQSHKNLAFAIHVRELNEPDIYVNLEFELPKDYPRVAPKVKITELEAFHETAAARIRDIVKTFPKQNIGRVIVHDLCTACEVVLRDVVSVRQGRKVLPSLEEERRNKQMAEIQAAEEQERKAQEQEALTVAQNDQLLEEQLRASRKQKVAIRKPQPAPIGSTPVLPNFSTGMTSFPQSMKATDTVTQHEFEFSTVSGNAILLQRKNKRVTIVTPVVPTEVNTQLLVLKQIRLAEKKDDTESMNRKMREIENILEETKDFNNRNIVHVFGYDVHRTAVSQGPGHQPGLAAFWELNIITEFSQTGSLHDHLAISGPARAEKVRTWTRQLLEALEFCFTKNHVHPAVNVSNILIFVSPSGEITLKLSDGYGTALRNLVTQANISEGSLSLFWLPPELSRNPIRTDKSCIWDLGVVSLQIALGLEVTARHTSPGDCVENVRLSDTFRDYLTRAFHSDPAYRLKAFDLQNIQFFRSNEDTVLGQDVGRLPPIPNRNRHYSQTNPAANAGRYASEYEQMTRLGAGGFGEVCKSRNLTDGQIYAIKKIKCSTTESLNALIAETKTLSRLNHPYIIRYFTSWYEYESVGSELDDSSNDEFQAPARGRPEDISAFLPSTGYDFQRQSNTGDNIQFAPDSEDGCTDLVPERNFDRQVSFAPNSYSFGTDEDDHLPEGSDIYSEDPQQSYSMSAPPPESTMLYIQMELCENKTLKNYLPEVWRNTDELWRVFRQILEGLDNIHTNNIVHRDLKPDNIFIDKSNNIRIGDFGLATIGRGSTKARPQAHMDVGPNTKSIGTLLYSAPELGTRGEQKYTTKADMWSLGIIFFEMVHPMDTYVERVEMLKSLALPNHSLPLVFAKPELSVQGRIILSLLTHEQDSRPSAAELLQSGDIPQPLEDEKIKSYLEDMATKDPESYERLLAKHFEMLVPMAKDISWDVEPQQIAGNVDAALTKYINTTLETVFHRHGAISTNRQTLFPKFQYYSGAATFLNEGGLLLQLPYDLTLPFARTIATGTLSPSKNYCFGTVYRATEKSKEPTRISEVAFDLVSTGAQELSLKDAEVIKVCDEVIQAFPELRDRHLEIHLNHADLLNAIMVRCDIREEQRAEVIRILSPLSVGRSTWKVVHDQLRSGEMNLRETALSMLSRFNFQETVQKSNDILTKLFEKNVAQLNRVAQIMTRMEEIAQAASRLGIKASIHINPLSNNSEQLYRGSIMFQCVDSKSKQLLAVGGRYDKLIERFQIGEGKGKTRAAGFRLNVAEITHIVNGEVKKNHLRKVVNVKGSKTAPAQDLFSPYFRRCDVVVTAFGEEFRSSVCLDVLQDLWANGISAELGEASVSVDDLAMKYASEPDCRLIIVRPDPNGVLDHIIKVRTVTKREEIEIRGSELAGFLKNELEDRSEPSTQKIKKMASIVEVPSSGGDGTPEVVLISSQHRGKKTNRLNMVEAALAARRELAASFMQVAPVVVVETTDDLLQALRNTRMANAEGWKAFIQSAPQQEVRYLQDLQAKLKEWAEEGKEGAFVYNHKTRGCIFYDLGKIL